MFAISCESIVTENKKVLKRDTDQWWLGERDTKKKHEGTWSGGGVVELFYIFIMLVITLLFGLPKLIKG